MNISYNAAVAILCAALGWPIDKAKHVLLTDMKLPVPQNRDEAGYVPVSNLGYLIRQNFIDRDNHEY